jgi:hypothetical protein
MPPKGTESRYAMIAFLGQVPIKVRGQVGAGDYIIPSGAEDGTGIAVPSQSLAPEQFSAVVGQAWESSDDSGVKKINCLVGISSGSQAMANVANLVQAQNDRIADLEVRLAAMEKLVRETHVDGKGGAQ